MARFFLIAVLGLWTSLAGAQELALAPDGHRGLGAQTPLADLRRLLRATDDEDADFLGELYALEGEIRVQLSKLREVYRSRRWFRLLDRKNEGELAQLHARYLRGAANPKDPLNSGATVARIFAEMLADTRFNVTLHVLRTFEDSARDLRAGLAVLRATSDGYVTLNEHETEHILRRVDLAAAQLRALRQDLLALRPATTTAKGARVPKERLRELIEIVDMKQKALRESALDGWLEPRTRQQELMLGALFTTRLAPKIAQELEWRGQVIQQKQPLVLEALQYLPTTPEGQDAPPAIESLKKSERMRHAQFSGLQGLAFDPLDEDLTWAVAMGVDFLWGTIESRPYFDRFLALRGIRNHDHRTTKDRKLTEREKDALFAVQRGASPLGR